jgi:hypothetical protein
MSIEILTFYSFLQNDSNSNEQIRRFKELFADQIEELPKKVMSSRALNNYFTLDTLYKRHLFNAVFMMYFKEKMLITK